MNIERYPLVKREELLTYEFVSEGIRGPIKKYIFFQSMDSTDCWYNLAFGDWNPDLDDIDDKVVSNNHDTQKVLNTVAYAVRDFMASHKTAILFVEGSCSVRTRLYQMNILRNLEEISKYYSVKGYYSNIWEPVRRGCNYEAFC